MALAESHTFRKSGLWPASLLPDSVHRQEVELPHFPAGFLQFLPAGRVVYRIVRVNSLQLQAEGRVSAPPQPLNAERGKKGSCGFRPLACPPERAANPEESGLGPAGGTGVPTPWMGRGQRQVLPADDFFGSGR